MVHCRMSALEHQITSDSETGEITAVQVFILINYFLDIIFGASMVKGVFAGASGQRPSRETSRGAAGVPR